MVEPDYFSQLPGELVEQICASLSHKNDLHNVRQTCKALYDKSYRSFAAFHFRTVRIMITRDSLQFLIDLAKDECFHYAIKELEIYLVTFLPMAKSVIKGEPLSKLECQELEEFAYSIEYEDRGIEDRSELVRGLQARFNARVAGWKSNLKRKRRRLHDAYMHDQNLLRTKADDVKMLTEALRNLPLLESITLRDEITEDELRGVWNLPRGIMKATYGMSISPMVATADPERVDSLFNPIYTNSDEFKENALPIFKRFCTHVIVLTFGAIIKSGIQLSGSLNLSGIPLQLALPKKETSRRLSPASTPARTFAESGFVELGSSLSMLNTLEVDRFKLGWNYDYLTDYSPPLEWIFRFTPYLRNVRRFVISGSCYCSCGVEFFRGMLKYDVFPLLCCLELKDVEFRSHDMLRVLIKYRHTLEKFCAYYCHLDVYALQFLQLILLQTIQLEPYSMRSMEFHGFWAPRHVVGHWVDPKNMLSVGTEAETPDAFRTELDTQLKSLDRFL